MKALILSLTLFTVSSFAYTPLDIKPGLWEYKTDTDAMMDAMLANVPEAQREMVKQMMKSKGGAAMAGQLNKPIYQCHTAEMIKDPEGVFEAQKKQNPDMAKCDFKMLSSGKTKANFKLKCTEKGDITVTVKTQGKTKQIIETKMDYPQPNTKIKSTATWVSSDCSKETKKIKKPKVEIPQ